MHSRQDNDRCKVNLVFELGNFRKFCVLSWYFLSVRVKVKRIEYTRLCLYATEGIKKSQLGI